MILRINLIDEFHSTLPLYQPGAFGTGLIDTVVPGIISNIFISSDIPGFTNGNVPNAGLIDTYINGQVIGITSNTVAGGVNITTDSTTDDFNGNYVSFIITYLGAGSPVTRMTTITGGVDHVLLCRVYINGSEVLSINDGVTSGLAEYRQDIVVDPGDREYVTVKVTHANRLDFDNYFNVFCEDLGNNQGITHNDQFDIMLAPTDDEVYPHLILVQAPGEPYVWVYNATSSAYTTIEYAVNGEIVSNSENYVCNVTDGLLEVDQCMVLNLLGCCCDEPSTFDQGCNTHAIQINVHNPGVTVAITSETDCECSVTNNEFVGTPFIDFDEIFVWKDDVLVPFCGDSMLEYTLYDYLGNVVSTLEYQFTHPVVGFDPFNYLFTYTPTEIGEYTLETKYEACNKQLCTSNLVKVCDWIRISQSDCDEILIENCSINTPLTLTVKKISKITPTSIIYTAPEVINLASGESLIYMMSTDGTYIFTYNNQVKIIHSYCKIVQCLNKLIAAMLCTNCVANNCFKEDTYDVVRLLTHKDMFFSYLQIEFNYSAWFELSWLTDDTNIQTLYEMSQFWAKLEKYCKKASNCFGDWKVKGCDEAPSDCGC